MTRIIYQQGQILYIDLNWMGTISNAEVTFVKYIDNPTSPVDCTLMYDDTLVSVNSDNLRVYK